MESKKIARYAEIVVRRWNAILKMLIWAKYYDVK